MKVAVITDTHFGARGDNADLLDSMVEFYDDQFFPTIEAEGCEHIIHAGDLVDRRKYINFKTLHTMREQFIKRIHLPTDIICGNHDTYYKNTNDLNALDELIGANDLFRIYTNPDHTVIGGLKLLYLPWITEENSDYTSKLIQDSDAAMVFGHLELTGFQMVKGQVCLRGLDHRAFKKFHGVYSGHFHLKSSHDNIHYLGSPYPMNWGESDNMSGFHILDTDTLEMKFYQNHRSMFNKLFFEADTPKEDMPNVAKSWVKVIVKEKPDPYLFDTWCDKLSAQNPLEMRIVEPITQVSEEVVVSEADDTPTIIDRTIDANLAMDDSDKEKLKGIMHELYNEASDIIVEK